LILSWIEQSCQSCSDLDVQIEAAKRISLASVRAASADDGAIDPPKPIALSSAHNCFQNPLETADLLDF
jgi:hypothetical protein